MSLFIYRALYLIKRPGIFLASLLVVFIFSASDALALEEVTVLKTHPVKILVPLGSSLNNMRPLQGMVNFNELMRIQKRDHLGLVYDFHVSRDEFGFRTVPQSQKAPKTNHLVIGGCSFAFGIGVNDHETMAAQLAKKFPNTHTVNLGIPGGGPSNSLWQWESLSFKDYIPEEKGIFVWIHMSDHVFRELPAWRNLVEMPHYFPRYEGIDELKLSGVQGESWRWKWMQILRAVGLEHLWLKAAHHFLRDSAPNGGHKVVSVLKSLKEKYLSQYPQGKFVVINLISLSPEPDELNNKFFEKTFHKANIDFYDFSHGKEPAMTLYIPRDGHPSADGHKVNAQLLAPIISKYLKDH